MEKYSEQMKLAAIKAYCSGQQGLLATARLHNVGASSLRKWVAAYQAQGIAGIQLKRREVYGIEFKLAVLQRIRSEGLSYRQAAAVFDIRHFNIIGAWERAYDRDGVDGLIPYGATRHKTMNKAPPPQAVSQPCDDEMRTRQELLVELNTLRLENAYLKKVDALVRTQAKSAQKKSRRS